mmetsp:Transcript_36663/g.56838  ORF Transcript_36663/g.56838 Transcript_36663/m.56838 type:complete len:247 (+) Transcript_36663:1-741(+)
MGHCNVKECDNDTECSTGCYTRCDDARTDDIPPYPRRLVQHVPASGELLTLGARDFEDEGMIDGRENSNGEAVPFRLSASDLRTYFPPSLDAETWKVIHESSAAFILEDLSETSTASVPIRLSRRSDSGSCHPPQPPGFIMPPIEFRKIAGYNKDMKKAVRFRDRFSVYSVQPYSEVYGMHPREFDFDGSGAMKHPKPSSFSIQGQSIPRGYADLTMDRPQVFFGKGGSGFRPEAAYEDIDHESLF